VVSGDLMVVVDSATDRERRVCLSSVRAPRAGNPRRDVKPEPYGVEAKEFLRQRLVGKSVHVSLDYSRAVMGGGGAGGADSSNGMAFGTVTMPGGGGGGGGIPGAAAAVVANGEAGETNVAVHLVARGLATVVRAKCKMRMQNANATPLTAPSWIPS